VPVDQQRSVEFARGERKLLLVQDLEPAWALEGAAVDEQFGTP